MGRFLAAAAAVPSAQLGIFARVTIDHLAMSAVDAKAVLVIRMFHRSADLTSTADPYMRFRFAAGRTKMELIIAAAPMMTLVPYFSAADAFAAIPQMTGLFAFELFEYTHIPPPSPAAADAAASNTLVGICQALLIGELLPGLRCGLAAADAFAVLVVMHKVTHFAADFALIVAFSGNALPFVHGRALLTPLAAIMAFSEPLIGLWLCELPFVAEYSAK
jgi:hypothetical protein